MTALWIYHIIAHVMYICIYIYTLNQELLLEQVTIGLGPKLFSMGTENDSERLINMNYSTRRILQLPKPDWQ